MSQQIIAYGATVERSTDGTTYTAIPECDSVVIPTVTTDYAEVTNLDSPNGFKEYIKGLKDAGEITLPMGYTTAGYTAMLADQSAADAIYYRVTLKLAPGQATSGDIFEFRGFPTPSVEAGGLGEPIKINVAIRTTGDVTYTAGA
jgi:hypothetical protein